MNPFRLRRLHTLVAAAVVAVTLSGCLDSTGTGEDEQEPQIAGVILNAAEGSAAAGSTTITTAGGQAGTLTLKAGVMNALVVQVLGTDAQDEPIVAAHHDEFEIRFLRNDIPLTSTMGSGYPLSFSVEPTGTGQQAYVLQVRSVEHDHVEFTVPILVTVQ